MLVLLSACGVDSRVESDPSEPAELMATRANAQCHGLDHRDVRGPRPVYTRKTLSDFRNDNRLCHGVWLPTPRNDLVPQGLAISGRTAWLSGFHYRKGYGQRPCLLTQFDIVTGATLAYHGAIFGRVGQRSRTYCRHGGGVVQRGKWLWIVEKNRLWLVDPNQKTNILEASRVWRLVAPVRGSAVVMTATRVGLVPYQKKGAPRIHWFSLKRLLAPGVLDLAVRGSGRRQLGAEATTRIPRFVQGATVAPNGSLYLARSNLSCGELVTPHGRRVAFIPGAEGIQFANGGKRLWVVSESGAKPYARSKKPLTPGAASYEWPRLLHGHKARCGFPAY